MFIDKKIMLTYNINIDMEARAMEIFNSFKLNIRWHVWE